MDRQKREDARWRRGREGTARMTLAMGLVSILLFAGLLVWRLGQ